MNRSLWWLWCPFKNPSSVLCKALFRHKTLSVNFIIVNQCLISPITKCRKAHFSRRWCSCWKAALNRTRIPLHSSPARHHKCSFWGKTSLRKQKVSRPRERKRPFNLALWNRLLPAEPSMPFCTKHDSRPNNSKFGWMCHTVNVHFSSCSLGQSQKAQYLQRVAHRGKKIWRRGERGICGEVCTWLDRRKRPCGSIVWGSLSEIIRCIRDVSLFQNRKLKNDGKFVTKKLMSRRDYRELSGINIANSSLVLFSCSDAVLRL